MFHRRLAIGALLALAFAPAARAQSLGERALLDAASAARRDAARNAEPQPMSHGERALLDAGHAPQRPAGPVVSNAPVYRVEIKGGEQDFSGELQLWTGQPLTVSNVRAVPYIQSVRLNCNAGDTDCSQNTPTQIMDTVTIGDTFQVSLHSVVNNVATLRLEKTAREIVAMRRFGIPENAAMGIDLPETRSRLTVQTVRARLGEETTVSFPDGTTVRLTATRTADSRI